MLDEMKRICICKYCNKPEYYGEFRWLSGKMCCRDCYKHEWEDQTHRLYTWDDLDGKRPTMVEYLAERSKECR